MAGILPANAWVLPLKAQITAAEQDTHLGMALVKQINGDQKPFQLFQLDYHEVIAETWLAILALADDR